jgi:hypothetical protein
MLNSFEITFKRGQYSSGERERGEGIKRKEGRRGSGL